MSEVNRLEWDAYIRDSELMRSIQRIENRMDGMVDRVKKSGQGMEDVFSRMAKAATAFFTLNQAQNFIQQLVRVRSEFQQLDIAFTTMLGSKQKADQLTKDLVEFVSTTPFGLKDTATAAKQLLAYGSTVDNVKNELRMLGDVASGTSQPIGELVYLYGTLRTQGRAYMMDIRQFAGRGIPIYKELAEVLKVDVSQVNAFVEAGKVGFAEVQKAFQNMTAQGSMFGGLMEAQSKTIQGELERLGDAYDLMLNKIGTQTEGTISNVIQTASTLIENYETVLNIIGALVITYGAYQAALIATAALQQISAARAVGMTSAELLHLGAISAKTAAMKVLNVVMAANPAILMTAGILGLTAAIYALTQATDATSAAQERLAVVQEAGAKRADAEKRSVEQLVAVIKDNTASVEQRKSAYDKLQSQTKGVLASFSQEEIAIGKASDALATYVQNIGRAASARKAFDEFNTLAEQLEVINRKGIDGVGIWERTGRAMQNAFGVNGSDAAKSFWGFGDKRGDQFIVDQQRDVLKKQMDELQKEFGNEFKGFISGVEQVTKDATPSSLFVEGLKDPIKNFNSLIKSVSNKGELDSLKKAITEKMEALAPGDSQIAGLKSKLSQIAKLEEAYSIVKPKSAESIENSQFQAAERYLALNDDIDRAREQMLLNQLSRDEQEIESTKQKYDSLRNEIRKFNADPKNKTKIDGSPVNEIEKQDLDSIRRRQTNEKQVTQYQEDYQNYIRYEELKKEAGEKYADEQLGSFKNTFGKIQAEINSLQARKFSEGLSSVDEAYLKQLEELAKSHYQTIATNAQNEYLSILKQFESYQQKRLALEKKYNLLIEKARTSGNKQQEERYKKELDEANKALLIDEVESSVDFKKAMDAIEKASRSMLSDAYKTGKEAINNIIDGMEDASAEEKSRLKKIYGEIFDKGAVAADAGKFEVAEGLISSFDQLVQQSSQFDGNMSSALKTISNMVSQVSKVTQSLGKTMQDASASLGAFGAVLGVLGTVTEIGENWNNKKQQEYLDKTNYAYEAQIKQLQGITSILEYQLSLIDDMYGLERAKSYEKIRQDAIKSLKESAAVFNGSDFDAFNPKSDKNHLTLLRGRMDGKKYQLTGISEYDAIIEGINKGQDVMKTLGNTPSKLKALLANYENMIKDGLLIPVEMGFKDVSNITAEEIQKLNELVKSNKLDDATREQVQNVIDQYEILKEATNKLREEMLGTSFSRILDSTKNLFFNSGENAGNAWKDGFGDIMEDYLKNLFSREYLEKAVQEFYELYDNLAKGGLTGDEKKVLEDKWKEIEQDGKKRLSDMEKDLGVDLSAKKSPQSELSKGITGITESTANRLEAEFGGLRIAQLQLVEVAKSNHASIMQIANAKLSNLIAIQNNTFRTANNTDRLLNIEIAIVELNKKVVNGDAIRRGAGL